MDIGDGNILLPLPQVLLPVTRTRPQQFWGAGVVTGGRGSYGGLSMLKSSEDTDSAHLKKKNMRSNILPF